MIALEGSRQTRKESRQNENITTYETLGDTEGMKETYLKTHIHYSAVLKNHECGKEGKTRKIYPDKTTTDRSVKGKPR